MGTAGGAVAGLAAIHEQIIQQGDPQLWGGRKAHEGGMFVVLLTYTRPLETVDALIPAHREFLQRMYDAGTFLLSGRKDPRDGGVILADAESPQALWAVLAQDPFRIHGVASYQVIRFTPTMAAPALQSLVAA